MICFKKVLKNISNKFSILTSIYDGDNYIKNYFNQIIRQKKKPNELVIIDDGKNTLIEYYSTKLKKKYPSVNIIIIKNKKNFGSTYSLNKGLLHCSNNIIFRLDADDFWHPSHTSENLKIIRKNPNYILYIQTTKLSKFNQIFNDKYFININTSIHSSWIINNFNSRFFYSGKKKEPEDYITLTNYLTRQYKIYNSSINTAYYSPNDKSHGKRFQKEIEKSRKKCSKKLFNFYRAKSSSIISFVLFDFGIFPFMLFLYKNYLK